MKLKRKKARAYYVLWNCLIGFFHSPFIVSRLFLLKFIMSKCYPYIINFFNLKKFYYSIISLKFIKYTGMVLLRFFFFTCSTFLWIEWINVVSKNLHDIETRIYKYESFLWLKMLFLGIYFALKFCYFCTAWLIPSKIVYDLCNINKNIYIVF